MCRALIAWLLVCSASAALAQTFTAPRYVLHWGGPGTAAGQFFELGDVACAADGRVYAVDRGSQRVQGFTAEGAFLLVWGQNGEEDGWFVNPSGIDIDADGNVFVADPRHPSDVRIFGLDGDLRGKIVLPTYRVAVDVGEVYGTAGGTVRVHAITGELRRSWQIEAATTGSLYDVSLFPDGRFAVTDTYRRAIYVMDREGNQRSTWGADGTFGLPSGVTSDGDFVYVADLGRAEVIVLSLDGDEIGAFPVSVPGVGNLAPAALTCDRNGALYVAAGSYIVKYALPSPVSATTWSKVKQLYRN